MINEDKYPPNKNKKIYRMKETIGLAFQFLFASPLLHTKKKKNTKR